MKGMYKYYVTTFPGVKRSLIDKILIFFRLKEDEQIFDIYINGEFKPGDIISTIKGQKYKIVKQIK